MLEVKQCYQTGQKLVENAKIKKMRHFGWFSNTVNQGWKLTSKIQYLDGKNPGKHCEFCRCEKCQRKPIFKMIRTVQETGRATLKKSEFGRVELNENAPGYNPNIFDVRIWKNGLIDWALEAIEKRHRKSLSSIIAWRFQIILFCENKKKIQFKTINKDSTRLYFNT